MKSIALLGSMGRMGQAIERLVDNDPIWTIGHRFGRNDDLGIVPNVDVIIDFSSAAATNALAKAFVGRSIPLLIGTTALSDETQSLLRECAKTAPVLIAPNTSYGVYVLQQLLKQAAQLLDDTFDIDIVDVHHRHKKDAPSGTAKALQETLRQAGKDTVSVHSIRAGAATGMHKIMFHGALESLEISHNTTSRDVFAEGALRLARWLIIQKPGLFTTEDAFGMDDKMPIE